MLRPPRVHPSDSTTLIDDTALIVPWLAGVIEGGSEPLPLTVTARRGCESTTMAVGCHWFRTVEFTRPCTQSQIRWRGREACFLGPDRESSADSRAPTGQRRCVLHSTAVRAHMPHSGSRPWGDWSDAGNDCHWGGGS